MKDKDWNPDDWQGRSRENVEASTKLAMISMIACASMLIGLVLYNLVVNGI
jgi:hypothetical protein